MTEEYASSIEQLNAQALHQMQKTFQSMSAPFGVVSDIDETIVHTVGRHVDFITRGAKLAGFKGNLPTSAEIEQEGGTAAYANIFGITPEEWEEIMARVRQRKFVNEKGKLYYDKTVECLTNGVELLGFLTAKPGTNRTLLTTEKDLIDRIGFPERPVILRPDTVPLSETSNWKIDTLASIKGDSPKGIVLVDDSISTAKAIEEHNRRLGKVTMRQILFKGPLTAPALEIGTYLPDQKLGIYPATWEEIPAIFDIINQECQ